VLQYAIDGVVSTLGSHRRDPGSIPCNVTFCPNLEIVTHGVCMEESCPSASLEALHSFKQETEENKGIGFTDRLHLVASCRPGK
jgi:hypothetical protein